MAVVLLRKEEAEKKVHRSNPKIFTTKKCSSPEPQDLLTTRHANNDKQTTKHTKKYKKMHGTHHGKTDKRTNAKRNAENLSNNATNAETNAEMNAEHKM